MILNAVFLLWSHVPSADDGFVVFGSVNASTFLPHFSLFS